MNGKRMDKVLQIRVSPEIDLYVENRAIRNALTKSAWIRNTLTKLKSNPEVLAKLGDIPDTPNLPDTPTPQIQQVVKVVPPPVPDNLFGFVIKQKREELGLSVKDMVLKLQTLGSVIDAEMLKRMESGTETFSPMHLYAIQTVLQQK